MKKKRHAIAAILILGLAVSLAGCSRVPYEPKISSLYVDRDGTVIGAEVTSFDNSAFSEERYKEEDLKKFVEDTVIRYNQEAGSPAKAYSSELGDKNLILPVSVKSLEVSEKSASLLLEYASCADYTKLNEADQTISILTLQTAPEAAAAGAPLDALRDKDGDLIDTEKEKASEKYKVLSASGTLPIVINGNILGISEGVSFLDDHTVSVPADATGYILFR